MHLNMPQSQLNRCKFMSVVYYILTGYVLEKGYSGFCLFIFCSFTVQLLYSMHQNSMNMDIMQEGLGSLLF